MAEEKKVLLEARGLTKEFRVKGGTLSAVSGVDLTVYEGETLAVVGESGCGKSTLGQTLIGLQEATAGEVYFKGEKISDLKHKEFKVYRRRMQLIFQDPFASMNPRMTVGQVLEEPLIVNKIGANKQEREAMVAKLLEQVGILREYADRYPHQFSGGQRQRIGIARALALNPDLIVCDEPVSALDVSIQAQILNLLHELQAKSQLTYLFISHDLSVVRYISDRTCVMFLGKVCEIGPTEELYQKPLHPYTRFLLNALPKPDPNDRGQDVELLSGEIPSPIDPPSGCRFHTRCPYAKPLCAEEQPECREFGGRRVYCHFPLSE